MVVSNILFLILGLVVGLVIGFLVSRKVTKKYLKENPPISEDMIKTLMMQMGRKPNQKQINQAMKSMQRFM